MNQYVISQLKTFLINNISSFLLPEAITSKFFFYF